MSSNSQKNFAIVRKSCRKMATPKKKRKAANEAVGGAKRDKKKQQLTLMATKIEPGEYRVEYEASSNESETIYITDPEFCHFWKQKDRDDLLRVDGIDINEEWDEEVHGKKPKEGSNLWPMQTWSPQWSTCEYDDIHVTFPCLLGGKVDVAAQGLSLDKLRALAEDYDMKTGAAATSNAGVGAAKEGVELVPFVASVVPRCEVVSVGGARDCQGSINVTIEEECTLREVVRRLDPEHEFGFEHSQPDYEAEVSFY